jgi:hypothetical protein
MGHAFVTIKGHPEPVECISEYHAQLKGRSEYELQIAAEELRKRNQRHAQQFTVTAAKLAHFITSVQAREALLIQRKRDYEARAVFALMEGQPQQDISPLQRMPDATHLLQEVQAGRKAEPTTPTLDESTDDDIYDDF